MLRRTLPRLLVRLLILTTLVSALLFTSADVTRRTVHANLYCIDCWDCYDQCIAGCPPAGQPGAGSCARYCRYELDECMHQLP
jgi:hypothetical protein